LGTEIGVASCTALETTQSNVVNAYLDMNQTRQILFSNPEIQSFEVPDSPLPPRSLFVSEKLFASITSYFEGAFDSGLFIENSNGYLSSTKAPGGIETVLGFRESCVSGIDLMKSKSFAEGRRYFSKASSFVGHLLREQYPSALEVFFDVLINLSFSGYDEIAKILRNLACEMAIEILPKEHPFRHIFYYINNLEDSHFEPGLMQAWRCISDQFTNVLGQFHPTALECYLDYITDGWVSNDFQLLRGLLIRTEEERGKFDTTRLHVKHIYGRALCIQEQYAESIEVEEDVLVTLREIGNKPTSFIFVFELLSLCHYHLGHEDNAEFTIREGIEKAVEGYGKDHPITLRFMNRLKIWLRQWGRETESEILKAEIDKLLGPDDIELNDA
jgi:hypothetical protein